MEESEAGAADAASPDAEAEDAEEAADAQTSEGAGFGRDAADSDAGAPDPLDAGDPDAESGADTGRPTAVDVLFMIDNSGSMLQEQTKLAQVMEDFFAVLTTGRLTLTGIGDPAFLPARSLHLGVVSSDMGVNGAAPQKGCGPLSFQPTERSIATAQDFLIKPLGDDGVLQTSTAVAVDGVWFPRSGGEPEQIFPSDPSCAPVVLPAGQRFVAFGPNDSIKQRAEQFRCIARLGKNGCGFEQQLEAVLKALTPPDAAIKFSASASNGVPSSGHGNAIQPDRQGGINAGFLRDDAVLVVILLSDEDDCSAPDASSSLFDPRDMAVPGEVNVRCGLQQNQSLLFPLTRYVDGLRALKPAAYQDRIIVASIVGVPPKSFLGNEGVVSGAAQIEAALNRDEMQFKVQRDVAGTTDEPVPACISAAGDGSAAPGRRLLGLTKAFGENGLAGSICEDTYAPVFKAVVDRVAVLLGAP